MKPIILTNAFRRPRATRSPEGVTVSPDRNTYACIEEIIDVITKTLAASPLILPTAHDPETVSTFLDHVDGILLPGSVSNIHPRHYGEDPIDNPQIFDEHHDATDMFLIREARKRGIPFLGICRAMQAMNLEFGGTLNQHIESKVIDHKCSYSCNGTKSDPEYMHVVTLTNQGLLHRLFDDTSLSVNSMHEQGINTLGSELVVEATAEDGIIEAISWPGGKDFFLGLQWHPETMPKNPVSQKIFGAFQSAIEKRFNARFNNQNMRAMKTERSRNQDCLGL
jgi:putative glutamine amidotransferase